MREHRFKVLNIEPEGRSFTAIASTFNVTDSYGERMMPGCYAKSLEKQMPVGVASHDWTRPIFAIEAKEVYPGDPELDVPGIDEVTKANGGLWFRGTMFDTKDAEDTYTLIKQGGFREFSVGYTTIADGFGDDGIRDIFEVDLHEISPVLVGANPNTQVIELKRRGSFDDHIVSLGNEVNWLVDRLESRVDTRLKEGRVLSNRNVALLETLAESLREAHAEIKRLLAASTPQPKDKPTGKSREQLRQLINSQLRNQSL
jgi:HK97 family phage prohead protease